MINRYCGWWGKPGFRIECIIYKDRGNYEYLYNWDHVYFLDERWNIIMPRGGIVEPNSNVHKGLFGTSLCLYLLILIHQSILQFDYRTTGAIP